MSEVRGQKSEVNGQRRDVGGQPSERARSGARLPSLSAFVLCLLSSVLCPLVDAQELKIGYVNVAKVFDGYGRTKASDATLEKKGKQKESEFEGRMNELKKLRESLELLNDQSREAKAREIEARADELKRFRTNAARDLRRERDMIAQEIFKDIQRGVEEFAKANGFTLVLDQRSLIYGQEAFDITEPVLKLLNSRSGAKP